MGAIYEVRSSVRVADSCLATRKLCPIAKSEDPGLSTGVFDAQSRRPRSEDQGLPSVDLVGHYSKPGHREKSLEELHYVLRAATDGASQRPVTIIKIRNIVRRLGQENIDHLVARYRRGETTTRLMEIYGLSKASVIHLLEANGVALRRQPLSLEQVEHAVLLYEGGHSLTAIEKALNAPRESLRRGLIDAGVTMRPRGGSSSRSEGLAPSL